MREAIEALHSLHVARQVPLHRKLPHVFYNKLLAIGLSVHESGDGSLVEDPLQTLVGLLDDTEGGNWPYFSLGLH